MITFSQACQQVGLDQVQSAPAPEIAYHAYKNGECKTFKTLDEAKKFSKLTERVILNKDEIDKAIAKIAAVERKAIDHFTAAVRAACPHLTDKQFSVVWNSAWDNSDRYDDILEEFDDRLDLINRFNSTW